MQDCCKNNCKTTAKRLQLCSLFAVVFADVAVIEVAELKGFFTTATTATATSAKLLQKVADVLQSFLQTLQQSNLLNFKAFQLLQLLQFLHPQNIRKNTLPPKGGRDVFCSGMFAVGSAAAGVRKSNETNSEAAKKT